VGGKSPDLITLGIFCQSISSQYAFYCLVWPANTCIPPSFLGNRPTKPCGIPTPKICFKIWKIIIENCQIVQQNDIKFSDNTVLPWRIAKYFFMGNHTLVTLTTLWNYLFKRTNPIFVISPKVAKVSITTVAPLGSFTVGFLVHFANLNASRGLFITRMYHFLRGLSG
jgi:hypothetical protein